MSLLKKPLILKRNCVNIKPEQLQTKNKIAYINPVGKNKTRFLFREDVIYESRDGDFLKGEYQNITLINKFNNLTNGSRTLAKCVTADNQVVEKTSDNVTKVIGQENYNILFHSLCSVINQEFRIRGILSLLTPVSLVPTVTTSTNTDTSHKDPTITSYPKVPHKTLLMKIHKACQTDETRLVSIKKKERKRIRRVLTPFVVQEPEEFVKKVIIDPVAFKSEFLDLKNVKSEVTVKDEFTPSSDETIHNKIEKKTESGLPELSFLSDDNSNDSNRTSLGSFQTTTELMINPLSLVNKVDEHTCLHKDQLILPNYPINLMDGNGTLIRVPFKPEDIFHIATKANLKCLNKMDQQKLLFHQMQLDYKYCITMKDEDGYLPIHLAVINNDIELLRRHCIVLKLRNQSVDIPAAADHTDHIDNTGLTALKLSIFQECPSSTSALLEHGADPLRTDEEDRAAAHHAAELNTDHLSIILHHSRRLARCIIASHVEELQSPGWQQKTDEQLADSLLNHMCCAMFDKRGNTPLMLACQLGHYRNVRLLLEAAPHSINLQMPNSGHTALFLAVAAACADSATRGNKSKLVDYYRKTIELLLEHGADPSIDNHAGSNVNLLLQDVNCAELSMLVADKIIHTKYNVGEAANCANLMLVKDMHGDVNITNITTRTPRKITQKKEVKKLEKIAKTDDKNKPIIGKTDDTNKPVIVENILIKPVQNKLTSSTGENKMAGKKEKTKFVICFPTKRNSDVESNSAKKMKVFK